MAQNMDFRNSFNGFNKEDVVRYLEYLQNKHASQVAELRTELAQAEQDRIFAQEAKAELEELRSQVAQLEAERDAAVTRADALETALCTARNEKAAATERSEEELEAYRRAERAERTACRDAHEWRTEQKECHAETRTRAHTEHIRAGHRVAEERLHLQTADRECRACQNRCQGAYKADIEYYATHLCRAFAEQNAHHIAKRDSHRADSHIHDK